MAKESQERGNTFKIAEFRKKRGMSQQTLATLIGVNTQTLKNWEKGGSGANQLITILKLCIVLDCNLEDLVNVDPEIQDNTTSFSLEDLRNFQRRRRDNKSNNFSDE